jgi:predicted transposase/invertase (TIGR01784 family)
LPEQITANNDTLTGYSYLMSRISFYRKQGKSINEAVEQAKQDTLAKGKAEEKIEIARNLLDVLDVPLIAKKTGLTIEEVEQLKN